MNMKIFYRSTTVWNILLYVMLSFVFIYLSRAIYVSSSIFEKEFLLGFLRSNAYIIALYVATCLSVYALVRVSKVFFILTALASIGFISYLLIMDFSKLITLILFLYIIISYYLYNFLDTQLNEAFYNPMFKEDNLFEPMLKKFKCSCELKDKKVLGYLTNWNENGFYIYLDEEVRPREMKNVKINIYFEEHEFSCRVKLVSSLKDNKSFGLKVIDHNESEDLSWFSFYQIIDKMGYQVEFLQ
jgi:hypothetical protein